MIAQEELEEMGVEVKGAAAMIRGFQEIFHEIASESCLDDDAKDELFFKTLETFLFTVKRTFENKTLLMWSDTSGAELYVLDTMEQASMWQKEAERIFEENPLTTTDDPDFDRLEQLSRFAKVIDLEQFIELAGDSFENPNNYLVDECGLSFIFEDTAAITRARESGRI